MTEDRPITSDVEVEEWLAARKREALEIDPETAEVFWHYCQIIDPYGVYPDLHEEYCCVGRVYFARRPEGIWVCFYDLPEATRNRLREKMSLGQLSEDADLIFRSKVTSSTVD